MAELDRFAKEDQELCSPQNEEEKEKKPRVSSEKEKEKTKIRERHRRSITTKILAGLRKHGNYNLPPRADINDVLRALAMEAGWTVEADGTTYKKTQQQGSGCPSRTPILPQKLGLTKNKPTMQTSPGTLASPSLTPTPSSSSLNSLGGFNSAPAAIIGIDPTIDQTGGDCSTTASPRYIGSGNNSGMGLVSSCPSPLISGRAEGLSSTMQFGSSIFLGGRSIPHSYVLNDDGEALLGLGEDHNAPPQVTCYFPGDLIESRDALPVRTPGETPSSSFSGVPVANTSASPLPSSFYCAQQLSGMVYNNNNTRNGLSSPSMIYNTQQQHPFLLEARASNQNTPIGSPQGIGVPSSLNLLYTQSHPFLQESRASNQNTPIGSPQPNGGTF